MPITFNECSGCGEYPYLEQIENEGEYSHRLWCGNCKRGGVFCYSSRNVIGSWEYQNKLQPALFDTEQVG